jgi:hypothetical protein
VSGETPEPKTGDELDAFLREHVEGYLFKDLESLAAIQVLRAKPSGLAATRWW